MRHKLPVLIRVTYHINTTVTVLGVTADMSMMLVFTMKDK
jgi:hypothetical protein